MSDRVDERTLLEIAGRDRGSMIAADLPPGSVVQRQTALDALLIGVALEAPALQDRQNLDIEELGTLVRAGVCQRHQSDQYERGHSHHKKDVGSPGNVAANLVRFASTLAQFIGFVQ